MDNLIQRRLEDDHQPFDDEECNDERDPKSEEKRMANLVMQQTECSRHTALECLRESEDGDIVGAILKACSWNR